MNYSVGAGKYTVFYYPAVRSTGTPYGYCDSARRALLVEAFDVEAREEVNCFVLVTHGGCCTLPIGQRCDPNEDSYPSEALLVPETEVLFAPVRGRLLIYGLAPPRLLRQEGLDSRFGSLVRHGNYVLMEAEKELSAFDLTGRRLWSRPVEAPWSYSVVRGIVRLTVAGKVSRFPLAEG